MKTNESPAPREVMLESLLVIDKLRQRAEHAEAERDTLMKDALTLAAGKASELRCWGTLIYEMSEEELRADAEAAAALRILKAGKEG